MSTVTVLAFLIIGMLVSRAHAGPSQGVLILSTVNPVQYLCAWENPPDDARDVLGGKARRYYRRGEAFRHLTCPDYYALVDKTWQEEKARLRTGPLFYHTAVWQCWYDDPCACERDSR